MPSPKPLTTTHFGLLCLLDAQPWSAYELVGQMGRSVGAVWPRAQSNLYADLKRLAADGLADTTKEATGGRPRTIYRITDAGRDELAAWLAEPGQAPTFECEALLKLAFAPATTKQAALAQIDVLAEHAAARVELGRRLAVEHLEGDAPLPERLHINAVMWRFLWEQQQAIARWAEWATEEVGSWPHTRDSPAQRQRGLESLRDGINSLGA